MSDTFFVVPQGNKKRFRIKPPGLSGWILISIVLGLAAGLFSGEIAGEIGFIGDAFIKLIQMTVLPYILIEGCKNKIDDYSMFFEGAQSNLDGVFLSAESGSAWTLLHPEFNVSVIKPNYVRYPVSIATGGNDIEFTAYVNRWISIIKSRGQLETLYKYWEQGKDKPEDTSPRWSVIRNVLGWIK